MIEFTPLERQAVVVLMALGYIGTDARNDRPWSQLRGAGYLEAQIEQFRVIIGDDRVHTIVTAILAEDVEEEEPYRD